MLFGPSLDKILPNQALGILSLSLLDDLRYLNRGVMDPHDQLVTLDGQSLMVLSQGYQSITWQRLRLKCCRSIRRSASKIVPIVVYLLCIYIEMR